MNLSRFSVVVAAALAGVVVFINGASAQDTNATSSAARRGPTMQQRVDRMATELKLNDEQKAKVTALLKKQAKQRREIVNDTNLSRQEHREKTRALIEEQNSELKTILTPEQFEKWQTLSAQMRTRRSGGPGHSGGPAPAPEPKSPDTKPQ